MNLRALVCALIGGALLLSGCRPAPVVEARVSEPPVTVSGSDRAFTGEVYVLNPASQRFHRPASAWAEKIAPERRVEWTGDRAELIAVGYQPCRYCEP